MNILSKTLIKMFNHAILNIISAYYSDTLRKSLEGDRK